MTITLLHPITPLTHPSVLELSPEHTNYTPALDEELDSTEDITLSELRSLQETFHQSTNTFPSMRE